MSPVSAPALSLLDDWLVHLKAGNASDDSYRNYRAAIRQYLEFIRSKDEEYDNVSHRILDRWRLHLTERFAPRTANLHISAARSWYRWLKWQGYVHDNPLIELKMVKAPRLLPKPLTEDEVGRLISAGSHPLDVALAEMFYATGCRIGEVRSMNVGGIDWAKRESLVYGKGMRERIVVFGEPAESALRAWLEYRAKRYEEPKPSDPLWIGRCKPYRRLSIKTMRKRLKRLAASAKITTPFMPKSLRHSFGTHMLEHGADIRKIQEMMGHKSLQSTQIYTEVSKAQVRRTFTEAHPRAKMIDKNCHPPENR